MTDPHDDHQLDELASAHVDGMTTPEEEEQIATDPELRRRVARLESVRSALAEGPPVDDDHREAAITAALEAFDDDRPSAVTRHADRRLAALPVLAAAAVVVLIAAVATLLLRDADDGELSADRASTADSEGAESGGSAEEPAATSDAPTDVATITDLGDFADLGALESALRADGGDGATTTSASSAETESGAGEVERFQTALRDCAAATGANAAAGARATVAGSPVLVVTRPAEASDAVVALVLDATTSAVLLEVAE